MDDQVTLILGIQGVSGERRFDTKKKRDVWDPPKIHGYCQKCKARINIIVFGKNNQEYRWPDKCPSCQTPVKPPGK